MSATPAILALDFDGVLCDGLLEYFQVSWRAYFQIWKPDRAIVPEALADRFYRLRPVVETGWEMPVLIQALQLDISESEIFSNWGTIAPQLLADHGIKAQEVAFTLDQLRDQWINTDLSGWLSLHRFYPGVVERLQVVLASSTQPMIISTKESRFIRQLLQQQGIDWGTHPMIGKESKQPKYQVLRHLMAVAAPSRIWFVEDRLKTLQTVQAHGDLSQIRLYLADWGYNTAAERSAAQEDGRVQLLSLPMFGQDFGDWPMPESTKMQSIGRSFELHSKD